MDRIKNQAVRMMIREVNWMDADGNAQHEVSEQSRASEQASIFSLSQHILSDYASYVQSFLNIKDEAIRAFLQAEMIDKGAFWPEPLLQLNPAYERAGSVDQLVARGMLHPKLAQIFYDDRKSRPMRLYRHQEEAVLHALQHQPYIVTSGTGSGKTMAYFIPIFDAVLKNNPAQEKVRAIIAYPMNALVNSQMDALKRMAASYKTRTGEDLPVRFNKYTGQERSSLKTEIQQHPPHILLTNYVMLELMLVRPEEHAFVDRAATGLEFLVLDELHTYRGRQGADVAMLVRRLRERCGNPGLLCIGTSATMVAGKGLTAEQRRQAVAEFGSRIFGAPVQPEHVIEERIQPVAQPVAAPTDSLRQAVLSPLPDTLEAMLTSPLTAWIESTYGIQTEADGALRRRTPIPLQDGAAQLAERTGLEAATCAQYLRQFFLKGVDFKLPEGSPLFAFKLHHFITQGQAVYATIEKKEARFLTLEGQYYAPPIEPAGKETPQRLLYPLAFCRVCGQHYYTAMRHPQGNYFLPWEQSAELNSETDLTTGYLMLAPENVEVEWEPEHLPAEWLDARGRVKRERRANIPVQVWVQPGGSASSNPAEGGIKAWFQPSPFMLCLNCGEFYTGRDKNDFRKLTRLSSEGRSTTTTVLSTSALLHAPQGGITDANAQKLLSFTDNRQDASLQAGHFNDFVKVSFLRSAIYAALAQEQELHYDQIAAQTVTAMGLALTDIAQNKELDERSPRAREVWGAFRDLVEYLIYEDLQRGWRVVQPNLEQCGLLTIRYQGLEELCRDDKRWLNLEAFKTLDAAARQHILQAILDHFRKKLAVQTRCLEDAEQQQLRRRWQAQIGLRWYQPDDPLRSAARFLLPGSDGGREGGLSLSEQSLIGRYLHGVLGSNNYPQMLPKLIDVLCAAGLLLRSSDGQTESVRLDGSALVWQKGSGAPASPDPIYSRQAQGAAYVEAQRKANQYFRQFYQSGARVLKSMEGREHTAQVSYADRIQREEAFINGKLDVLFCSPTMELGVDIKDLQLVHMRNVPPTPANYAQRSGRAGRGGDPALVVTYCAAQSPHDQYFFRHRSQMVAGAVRAPRIDLGNEALIRAHLHAIWLARVSLALKTSMTESLDLDLPGCPLNANTQAQIQLSPARFQACLAEAQQILSACQPDLDQSGWYSPAWLEDALRQAPRVFDQAFDRWRELYQTAQAQWEQANDVLRNPPREREARENAERLRAEAERQKNLLCNIGVTAEESDFYPYRYLASEGFLPGYNFPRLPVRAFIPRGDGEYIARPRFLALTEFGPQNIIYHEGAKYQVNALSAPPGGLAQRLTTARLCGGCGYYHPVREIDHCERCGASLDASNSEALDILEMPNVRTLKRVRITSDEEERERWGFQVSTHFRFAQSAGGQLRCSDARVVGKSDQPLLNLTYAPSASLFRVNHGWRARRSSGFTLDLGRGTLLEHPDEAADTPPPAAAIQQRARVNLMVQDTENLLLARLAETQGNLDLGFLATLQYALQRGLEAGFQVEEAELASDLIGTGANQAILFWEAAEGGVGVLRRLVDDREALSQAARAALERLHFDPDTLEDLHPDCAKACHECLLSYTNQRSHHLLDRRLVKDFLARLAASATLSHSAGRTYEEQYQALRPLTDSLSDLERRFLDYLFEHRLRLPDKAQVPLADIYCVPDFFYPPNVCVFCDGSVHDQPDQARRDRQVRAELRERGYRVVVIRYDQELAAQIKSYSDIFS